MKYKKTINLELNNKKRRKVRLTNYTKRLKLLKSKLPRLVIRKSNHYILAQLVEYAPTGDKVLWTKSTKDLILTKILTSGTNLQAAFLLGKDLLNITTNFVVDIGMRYPKKDKPFFVWNVLRGLTENLNLSIELREKIKENIKKINYDNY